MQTTAQSIRAGLEKAMIFLAEGRPRRHAGRHRPKYSGADLRAISAKNGVGRPRVPHTIWPFAADGRPLADPPVWYGPYHTAAKEHGSQRAAARALGLNLSTFQRRLAKEAA